MQGVAPLAGRAAHAVNDIGVAVGAHSFACRDAADRGNAPGSFGGFLRHTWPSLHGLDQRVSHR